MEYIDKIFGVAFLFWPLVMAMVVTSIVKVPKVFIKTTLLGYASLIASFGVAASYYFFYYMPVAECVERNQEGLWSDCSSLTAYMVEWIAEWNYITINILGISAIGLWAIIKKNLTRQGI